jgi:DNA polymerase III epsilon subunit-like protein
VLTRLDAADRLARVVEERGFLPVDEAARLLFALPHGSGTTAVRILDQVVCQDARLARSGPNVVLAPSPLAGLSLEHARFAVVDLETSGLSVRSARPTEIGIVVLEGGQVRDELGLPIAGESDQGVALRALRRHGARAVIAGHNLAFDLGFIDRELQLLGNRIAAPTVDTLALARRLLRGRVERMTLIALAEFFGVDPLPCHRALPDARATAHVLLALIGLARDLGARTVGDLCGLARSRTLASSDRSRQLRSIV